MRSACTICGCGRTTDTWAQCPLDGTQGHTITEYTPGEYSDVIVHKKIERAKWRYQHAPTANDDEAVGADLVDPVTGDTIASCLFASGELDIESDGCGVFLAGVDADDIDWPDAEEARRAVWGEE